MSVMLRPVCSATNFRALRVCGFLKRSGNTSREPAIPSCSLPKAVDVKEKFWHPDCGCGVPGWQKRHRRAGKTCSKVLANHALGCRRRLNREHVDAYTPRFV